MRNKTKMNHLYTTSDLSIDQVSSLIELALAFKYKKLKKYLEGSIMAMLFFNPSLRTRLSFMTAMIRLGGVALDFPLHASYPIEYTNEAVMDTDTIEHVKDAARVIGGYVDCIGIRASELITTDSHSATVENWELAKKDTVINSFMQNASVPVINMESNVFHPCQGLGDAVTIKEKLGNPRGKKYVFTWVPHPKALPTATPNSQMISACELGMDVVVVHPPGWELDEDIIKIAQSRTKETKGSLRITHNQTEALRNAKIVCSKSWGALKYYGDWAKEKEKRDLYKDWIIDKDKMRQTDDGYFMHCLPIRRNVEATDEVLDSSNSLIYDEAENRMWAQMAIIAFLLEGGAEHEK